MATEIKFDPVKAAQASSLIKSGVAEEEAFRRAGINEEAYGVYQIDDVPGSPTRGQVTKGFDAVVYDESEQKTRNAAYAKQQAEEEAAAAARATAREQERLKNLERIKAEKEAEKAAAKKGWANEEDNTETTGPTNTRSEITTTVSGGGVRETKMTAEMADWSSKSNQASKADAAATQAAKDEYLRSKGLDQSSLREKSKALREAEANGTNFTSTANKDALGEPPANQYEDTVISANRTGTQTPNDGTQTADQAAKESAKGQTADAAVDNTTPKEIPGEGTVAPDADTVTDAEADKIKNNQQASEQAEELPPNAFPAPPPSESKIADRGTKTSESAKQNSIVGATSNSTQATNSDKNNNEKQKELSLKLAKARTNKLHDYASSTYRITMYLLSALDYAELVARPASFDPKLVLIRSGGGFANDATFDKDGIPTSTGRHPDFREDFFFEQLSMTTVVGLNAKSKASNAIEISFTIVEPYGMTLLDRLMSACSSKPIESNNYIDQPYLLEVDFLANVDEESKQKTGIRIDRKRVAIKIIEMKIKPGTGGTEYRCRAIPFNHVAFQDSIASMPITLNVQADTVGKFFDSESEITTVLSAETKENQERIESELKKWTGTFNEFTPPSPAEIEAQRNKIKASLSFTVDSFPAAYNTYMRGIAGSGKTFAYPPSLIAINITDPDIKKSLIVDEKSSEVKAIPMAGTTEGINASVRNAIQKDGKTKQGFPVSPGTNIVQLIDRVMQSSAYITNQVKEAKEAIAKNKEIIASKSKLINDPSGDAVYRSQLAQELREAEVELKKYEFLDWYKIVPQVFLLNFDFSRNAYSKQAIYTIQKYKAANAYHPDFHKTRINKSKIVRAYNYLYTGLNQDILSIDIDFDSSYYTAITAFQDNKTKSGSRNIAPGFEKNNVPGDLSNTAANPTRTTDLPHTYGTQGSNATAAGQLNRANSDKASAVSDIANSIYTSQRGDMLNVTLKIVGDPAFIKQDDIYYNPMSAEYKEFNTMGAGPEQTVPLNPNTGQIIFDQEQVFVQLLIKSAVDIDDATGITNKQIKLLNGRTTDSTFSGVYKVLTVKSDFNRGKFEQTLTLVKMPNDLFFDDTVPKNPGVTTVTPQLANNKDPAASKPPAEPNENVAQEATGQSTAETDKLKEAAAQPATNPATDSPGAGTVASAPQPADAAPTNANDAQAVAPQEKSLADVSALLAQYSIDYEKNNQDITTKINQFNATLRQLRANNTLSSEEKAEQAIALRKGLQESLNTAFKQNAEIANAVFPLSKQPSISGTNQFIVWNTLAKRLNNNAATLKEYFTGQEVKIQDIIQTGSIT